MPPRTLLWVFVGWLVFESIAFGATATTADGVTTSAPAASATPSASADTAPSGPAAPNIPAPPLAAIVRPKPIDTSVPYPGGATGAAAVILELTVERDGSVSDARVLGGPEPFATAARDAAQHWKFTAATRDGIPIRARVRFETRFEQERRESPEAGAGVGASTPPAAKKRSTAKPESEVTVAGQRPTPGSVSVSRAESRMLPGAFGDPFRAVESLPGVTPIISGVPFFFIRGAPPGNVGFFIDGIRVPLLFHALVGPAVIHPSLVDRMTIYRGGYPARFGRFAGGVVAADTVTTVDALHGEADISSLDAGGILRAPFDEGRGRATAAGHYSYTGPILSALTDVKLAYWDYQALVAYRLSRDDEVGIFAFGAYDFLGQNGDTLASGEDFAGTEFHRVDLRYDHTFAPNTKAHAAVTLGYDRSQVTRGDVSDRSIAGRTEIEHRMPQRAVLRVGGDVSVDRYSLDLRDRLSFHDVLTLFPERTDVVAGLYVDFELHPERWFMLVPGVRADIYHSQNATEIGVDPRISALFAVTKNVRLIHSFGIAHQSPNYIPNLPGAQVGGLRGGLQESIQSSAGVEVNGPEDTTGSVTVFEQAFFNLSDPLGFSRTIAASSDVASVRANGYAFGAEFMVRRALTRKLGGMLSYTLSRSVRSHDRIASLSAFDHTHVAIAALSYAFGRGWQAGVRASFVSGVPTRELTVDGPRFIDQRAPPFFRLDLRGEKRWRLGRTSWWGISAEVLNATAAHEVVERSCNPVRCTEKGIGPLVLPRVALEIGF